MRKLLLLAAALATCTPVQAAPARSRAAQQLYDKGFHDCAGALDRVVKAEHDDDTAYSFLDVWSTTAANTSLASTLTVQQYSDARVVRSISVVKNPAGKCDVVMTSVFPILDQTCTAMRATAFKDWKLNEELGAVEIYQDPSSPSSTVTMHPLGLNGCLLVKQAVGYEAEP